MAETQSASAAAREVDVLTAARNGSRATAGLRSPGGRYLGLRPCSRRRSDGRCGRRQLPGLGFGRVHRGRDHHGGRGHSCQRPAQALTFGVADETAWRAGLPCGGQVQVFVERIDVRTAAPPSRPCRCRRREPARPRCANASRRRPKGSVRAQRRGPASGHRRAVSHGQEPAEGNAGRRCFSARPGAAGTYSCHWRDAHRPGPHPARAPGLLRGDGLDPRTAFASADRFPDVKLLTEWPQDVLPKVGLDPYTAVVALAHVGHIDDEALKLAVQSDCLYIGALGSAATMPSAWSVSRRRVSPMPRLPASRPPSGLTSEPRHPPKSPSRSWPKLYSPSGVEAQVGA